MSRVLKFLNPSLPREENPGASMPHITTTTTSAAAAMEGGRLAEVETDQVLTEDRFAGHQPSPAKTVTKPTATKKGGPKGTRTRTTAGTTAGTAKPAAAAKPTPGRRKKIFDTTRAQAAHERAQDLRSAFSTVQKALKGPLNEIADRSISELLENPTAIERTPEFTEAKSFLDRRLADQMRQINSRHETELAMARHVYEAEVEARNRTLTDQIGEMIEEALGQGLEQLDILELLHDSGLPLDLPALAQKEGNYLYKPISQEDADTQGPFIEIIDGAYVPVSGKPLSELMTKKEELTMPATPKRKIEDQPEGQPAPKIAAIAKDGDLAPKMQRHPAGLLAAVEALEDRASEAPPSNAPSPRAEPLDAPSPGNADQARTSGVTTPRDPLEIPVPRGASSPDENGVRLISRKATQMNIPNNRIMVPLPFQFEDHEIGFRDSTNSLQKGATKARRGRYIDKPNSNFLFIDRRVGTWDSTNPEDEFDQELIKKHRLHPTLGIVLPTSVNDWEPPKPVLTGWSPVVLVGPDGKEIHASRTIPTALLDQRLQRAEDKAVFRKNLGKFCEDHGYSEDDIAPPQDVLQEFRRKMLIARGMDPDQELPPSETASDASQQRSRESTTDNIAGFSGFVEETLHAASILEAEEEAERLAASNRPQSGAQSSRPYDAIRDVFTDSSPPFPTIQPAGSTAGPDLPPVGDTYNLSCLADAAEQQQPDIYQPAHSAVPPQQQMGHGPVPDHSAIDPSLFGQGTDGTAAVPASFDRADMIPSVEYPHPEGPVPMAGFVQQNENDFLRTALNPQSTYPPSGAPPQDLSMAGRSPFTNAGAAKGLPALRPVRSLLNESSPPPDPQDSPGLQHPNMVVSNSGAFFPPAPNRPFHTGFSVQEQVLIQSSGIPGQPGMPPQMMGSPPEYQTGPAPVPIPAATPSPAPTLGPAPLLPAGLPQLSGTASQGPGTPSPRSRPGSSSASSSAKYRKLEPAPTPPHRMGYPGGGQELRTVQFDYREQIKDYPAMEAPPRHGPTHIRGWTHNNQSNIKKSRPSSKGDAGTDEPS